MTKPFVITDYTIAHLKACASQGKTLSGACKELRVSVSTLKDKAESQGLKGVLEAVYPDKHSGIMHRDYDPVIFDIVKRKIVSDPVLEFLTKH